MVSRATSERQVTQAQLERLANWSMRKPVIALMGEFSAGKSTLMNLLIGQNILPTQITATRMPPVWLTYGDEPPHLMDHDGKKHDVDLSRPEDIQIKTTRYVRLFVKADILKNCDLIDTPGISDPNIKTSYWLRTIRYANAVMWCTHASQAWRESERGAWEALPLRLRETSILLVTRKDKITSERDLRKIRRRLERETTHLFNSRMFVSLTNAIKARVRGDSAAWAESGAAEFSEMLEKIVEGIYVQRSFMLARYLTHDGAKGDTKGFAETDTNNMLGFVGSDEGGNGGGYSAESDTVDDDIAPVEIPSMLGEAVVEYAPDMPASDEAEDTESPPATEDEDASEKLVREDSTPAVSTDADAEPVEQASEDIAPDVAEQSDPATRDAASSDGPHSGGADMGSYRLADPSVYHGAQKRVDLSNYRLKDPAQYDPDPAQAPAAPEVLGLQQQLALLQAIWSDAQQRHDMSKAPDLVRAMEKLMAEMQAQAGADTSKRKSA